VFMQNNDMVSFGSMAELLTDPNISQGWKDHFNAIRNDLNSELHSPTLVEHNGAQLTYWELFQTFLYGNLGHSDKKLKVVYKTLRDDKMNFPMAESEFHNACILLVTSAANLASLSRMELDGEVIPPA